MNVEDELNRLQELHCTGAISNEDYALARERLIELIAEPAEHDESHVHDLLAYAQQEATGESAMPSHRPAALPFAREPASVEPNLAPRPPLSPDESRPLFGAEPTDPSRRARSILNANVDGVLNVVKYGVLALIVGAPLAGIGWIAFMWMTSKTHVQKKMPNATIPETKDKSIHDYLKKIYEGTPLERVKAIRGLRGRLSYSSDADDVAAAIPFLIACVDDNSPVSIEVQRKLGDGRVLKSNGGNVTPGMEAVEALELLTKQQFGNDPTQWTQWWEANKATFWRNKE